MAVNNPHNDVHLQSPAGEFLQSKLGERGLYNQFLIGGRFTLAGAVTMRRLCIYDPVALTVTEAGGGVLSGIVRGITQWRYKAVIVGSFSEGGGKRFVMTYDGSSFAAINTGVTSVNVGDQVYCAAVIGDDLIIGGHFTEVDGVACEGTAKYTTATGTWGPWHNVNSGGTIGTVYSILVDGSDAYIFGDFDFVDGVAINAKSKNGGVLNIATGPLGGGFCTGGCFFNGHLFVCGNFSRIDGDNASNLAYLGNPNYGRTYWHVIATSAVNPDGLSAVAASSNAPMVVYNGQLIVVGNFLDVDSVTGCNRIVGIDASDVAHKLSTGCNGTSVNGLAVHEGDLYVFGDFTSPASKAARWDGSAFSSIAGFNDTCFCGGAVLV